MRTRRLLPPALAAAAALAVALYPAAASPGPGGLVAHEWGTFTSFSGSDGVPAHFSPANDDLPDFVYRQSGPVHSKVARLQHDGTVSMETPVVYLYGDPGRVSVRVNFPSGWLTEWYPAPAAGPPTSGRGESPRGQSLRWEVTLTGDPAGLPREQNDSRYYRARETDSTPLRVEVPGAAPERGPAGYAGERVQREKFLFYRGVGTFPPPVSVRALGDGKVRIRNTLNEPIGGLVLVTVRGGKVGFRALDKLEPGWESVATLPEATERPDGLAALMARQLTAAGLYEKEARAMVRTWDTAWFGEDGNRLFYLVPRAKTDEILPLTVVPKPTAVERVFVGRHDFLTPEREADADRLTRRIRAAEADLRAAERGRDKGRVEAANRELTAADRELRTAIGRFADQARAMAAKRLDAGGARR